MLDPPLQHALFHVNMDYRERHYVQTCCGLTWEAWDAPTLDEQQDTNCLLCWHALRLMEPPYRVRIVRGRLVEVYDDRRTS